MKINILLFLLLFSGPVILHAQDPIPFPDTGASWMTIRGAWDGTGNSASYGYAISLDGDTLIDGEIFINIALTRIYYTSFELPGDTYADDTDIPFGHIAAMRTVGDQVYLRAFNEQVSLMSIAGQDPQWAGLPLDTTFLLYDFSLQPGDTVFYPIGHTPVMFVALIDSVLLNDGLYHRQFHFAYPGAVDQIWLEGVGSLNGPFGAFLPTAAYIYGSNWLSCFKQNEIYVYGTDSCDLIEVETPDAVHNATAPVADWYVWENKVFFTDWQNDPMGSWCMYNLSGEEVFCINNLQNGNTELPELSNGIYVGVLQNGEGEKYGRRILLIR